MKFNQFKKIFVFRLFTIASLVVLPPAFAGPYAGKLVDAHNQFGCDVKPKEIAEILERSSIDLTLLSVRETCYRNDRTSLNELFEAHQVAKGRVQLLIPTKLGGNRGMSVKGFETLQSNRSLHLSKAVGFAEIIIQHPEHDYKNNKAPQTLVSLYSTEAQRMINLVKDSGRPVILHIEPRDFPHLASGTHADLGRLAQELSPHPIVLIHMGQSSAADARVTISQHPNVHYLLSTSDPFSQRGIQRREAEGEKAQTGWINLFEDFSEPFRRERINKLAKELKWKSDWERLIRDHPERFIFAIDSVYRDPWIKQNALKAEFWRHALGKLPAEVAEKLACGNAKRLWKLDLDC